MSAPAISTASLRTALPVLALVAAGFGLTLYIFYPGVMTFDARFVHEDIAKNVRGDWQSPAMTELWALIDPIAPGSASMFVLIVTLYWLAFGLLAVALARHSFWPAFALVLLALSPPAFVFVGTIWRDVLFATVWLLAAALALTVAGRSLAVRLPAQLVALSLLTFGVLLRPNAIVAAPILVAYLIWPSRFSWRGAAIIYAPAVIALYASVQLVYYGALGATRQHPLHAIMVFDLGGISHFAKQNQFPVSWNDAETTLVTSGCYQPTEWDIYWRFEPCKFVMDRLEREKIFGSSALAGAWRRAIIDHPGAYLRHRAAFMWNFLTGDNLTMWTQTLEDPPSPVFADRAAFTTLRSVHDVLKPTPLFRAGTWLLASTALCALAWRRRDWPAGAFVVGVCGSAVVYIATFFAVGVASDFRYAYWAVLASLAGTVASLTND